MAYYGTMNDFTNWLNKEMDSRGIKPADLAKTAKISQATLSMILSGQRGLGPDVGLNLAIGLNLPPEVIFRKAGLLPSLPPEEVNVQVMAHLFRQLNPIYQQQALNFVRAMLSQQGLKIIRESEALYEALRDTQTETALELIDKYLGEVKQEKGR